MRVAADLFVWLGEALSPAPRPPARALGLEDGAPVLLVWRDGGYRAERPAGPRDRAPLRLGSEDALTGRFETAPEAALHGAAGARVEAARRCPFPLSDALWSVERAPEAWGDGAPWRFAAAPLTKAGAVRGAVAAAGATPGAAFAMVEGAPVFLPRSAPKAIYAAAGLALLAAVAAAASVTFAAARMEAEAESRLSDARIALAADEAAAARAAAARQAAAAPMRDAEAAAAILAAAPSVGAALIALTEAVGDDAHLRRLAIRPGVAEGEFAAPDAAALAAALTAADAFGAARLKSPARADASSGLQRAVLEVALRPEDADQ